MTETNDLTLPDHLQPPELRPAPDSLWVTVEDELTRLQTSPPHRPHRSHPLRGVGQLAAAAVLAAGLVGGTLLLDRSQPTLSPAPAATSAPPTSPLSTPSPSTSSPADTSQPSNVPLSDAQAAPYLEECAKSIRADGRFYSGQSWQLNYATTFQPKGVYTKPTTVLMFSGGTWFFVCSGSLGSMSADSAKNMEREAPLPTPTAPAQAIPDSMLAVEAVGNGFQGADPNSIFDVAVGMSVSPKVAQVRGRLIINGTPSEWFAAQPDRGIGFLQVTVDTHGSLTKAVKTMQLEYEALDVDGNNLLIALDVTSSTTTTTVSEDLTPLIDKYRWIENQEPTGTPTGTPTK